MACTPRELDEILSPCLEALREDLEALKRLYSREELIELWNRARRARRLIRTRCAESMHGEKAVRSALGRCTLAMLLAAAALRSRGETLPGVTDVFSEEEYRVIEDLEKYKVLDYLDPDEIAEYIARREGRVYEFVKEYYERQYNALDRVWGPLLGDMMSVVEERYRERRRRIEEAVKRYIEKHGLLPTILEIEDAVKRMRLVEEERRRAEEIAESLEKRIEKLFEEERREEAEKALEEAARELRRILEKLGREKEITGEAARGPVELLRIEAEVVGRTIDEILEKLRRYEALARKLRLEKEMLRRSLEGDTGSVPVTTAMAAALSEAYVSRLWRRLEGSVRIYSGVEKRAVEVRKWDEMDYGGGVIGKSYIRLVKKRGIINRSPRIMVEMRMIYHHRSYAEKGYDDKRAGLGDIISLVSARLEESVAGGYYTILILASPTGFTEKALDLARGRERYRSIYSGNLTLYLVDLSTGKLYYNDVDEAAIRNKWIAEPLADEEKIATALEHLLSEETIQKALARGTPPYVTVEELAESLGIDEKTALIAMARAMEMGRGRVARLRTGRTVFIYNA